MKLHLFFLTQESERWERQCGMVLHTFSFFLTWGSAEITVVLQLFARLHMHASFVLSIGIAATFDLKNEASSHQQQQLVAQGPKFGVVMSGLLLVRSGSTKRW